ncbi:MAG: dihydropteroate synthase, partial [Paludibacter sp.]|nr:dihydropteroate synthase [Paludibacter sp.]
MFLNLNGKLLDLTTPAVMGIINLTPDSFYQASRYGLSDRDLLRAVEKMIADGADIFDFGGYSTRPDAKEVLAEEEIRRLSNGLEVILKHFPDITVSIDTFRASVAAAMVKNFGVAIINDIGGGTLDDLMFETVAELRVAYILMHTRGTPQTMKNLTNYENLIAEVMDFFQKRIAQLRIFGVNDIIADPGFGFAKTLEQNYELLSKLSYFQELNVPILAGISRKSMLCKLLDIEPKDALNATTAANMLALAGGAKILRVHDVKEAKQAVKIMC